MEHDHVSTAYDSMTEKGDRALELRSVANWYYEFPAKTPWTEAIPRHLADLAADAKVDDIRWIYLDDNDLVELPDALRKFTGLEEIDARSNKITRLPSWLGELPKLESLILRENPLDASALGLEHAARLRELDISNTRLRSVPAEIGNLKNLRILRIGENAFKFLPDEFGQLEQLEELNVFGHRMFVVPESIRCLRNLRDLNIAHGRIRSIPSWLDELRELRVLHLSHFRHPRSLQLHESLWSLSNLEVLILADLGLPSLPSEIGRLAKLKELYVGKNTLIELPDSIRELTELATLDVRSNELRRLPDAVCELRHLERLSASFNELESVPRHLGQLTELRELDLNHNQLTSQAAIEIAKTSSTLRNLEVLDLANNKISDTACSSLGDAVSRSPWRESLRELDLEGNPIHLIPPEYLGGGIRHYWSRLSEAGGDVLREVKLVLLGEGRVGKSHIRKRCFERDELFHDHRSSPTQDVDLVHWTVSEEQNQNKLEYGVRVLDFGGQPNLHSGHRLFFSDERSIFVIVCDAKRTREDNRLDYWMQFVLREASKRCPVIVVVTQCDLMDDLRGVAVERKLEPLDAESIRKAYGFPASTPLAVVDGIGWSRAASESSGAAQLRDAHRHAVDLLREAVKKFTPEVPGLKQQHTIGSIAMLRWLQHEAFGEPNPNPKPYLTLQEFASECRPYSLAEGEQWVVLDIARHMGIVHFVGHHPSVRSGDDLGSLIFNPEWVKTPVYRILQARERGRRGILPWKEVEAVLPEHPGDPLATALWERVPFSASDRVLVVDLMEAHGLVMNVAGRGEEPRYFVPDHLPGWAPSVPLDGKYVWKCDVPDLVEADFHELIGRLHEDVGHSVIGILTNEITFHPSSYVDVTVRLVAGGRSIAPASEHPAVYVQVRGCGREKAAQHMQSVAVTFARILKKPLSWLGKWTLQSEEEASSDGGLEKMGSESQQYAGKLYDIVKSEWDKGRVTVGSWKECFVLARPRDPENQRYFDTVFNFDEDRQGSLPIAADAFRRYCGYVNRYAWWKRAGSRGSGRSIARGDGRPLQQGDDSD